MTIATLYQPPMTEQEFSVWSAAHQSMHRDIARVVFEQAGTRLDEFVLDPFDPADMAAWLETHQIMHQQMDAALGISGFDLSEVEWRDRSQLTLWLRLHGDEHVRVGAILNLG